MNLHEYQGKALLKKFDVSVPTGILVYTAEEAFDAANRLKNLTNTDRFAIKAQVHAGGRGKGGGVKIASTPEEVKEYSEKILGMYLVTPQTKKEGKLVRKVLVEENIYYKGESEVRELYISILTDRRTSHHTIVYSPCGGMEIEKVAEETPEKIFREEISPILGVQPYQCRKIAFNLGLSGKAFKEMMSFITRLYNAYISCDSSLFEINPVIKAADDRIFAADAKVVIDNNALFRHPEIAEMRDTDEEDPSEFEAGKHGLNFIKLDGNVGCMVNGAGLAMATMDLIKLSGGEPANFLDVGGSANAKRVEEALRIIISDSNVKAILINIFGGIVRCDRVATGITDAYKSIGEIKIPLIVRLQGTNAEEAKEILKSSGLKLQAATSFSEAAELVTKAIN